jgi:hypothetical protein
MVGALCGPPYAPAEFLNCPPFAVPFSSPAGLSDQSCEEIRG